MAKEKEKKIRTVVSGAAYWSFDPDENGSPHFQGFYVRDFERENDSEKLNKEGVPEGMAGDIIGFIFADENGEEHIIANSFLINKALDKLKDEEVDFEKHIMHIDFKGQGTKSDGQKFNRFTVGIEE